MAGSMPERASIGALKDGGVAQRSVVHLDRTDGAYAFLDDWSERFRPPWHRARRRTLVGPDRAHPESGDRHQLENRPSTG